jgi:hypothetical protein
MSNRTTITPGDGDPRHGTANGYHNLGCHSPCCREAWATEMRAHRTARAEAIDPDDTRHGTASFYQNHGCRCLCCREARLARCSTARLNGGLQE